ncbi:MAG: TraB/GumN family protein [Bacteroidales bacterium]|nr:TraB/GumN family protein [Bacteroidales bacterium]
MKKIVCTLTLSLLASFGCQAQLLYRISSNELAAPSYIVGTYHLAPVAFADSIPGLAKALEACEQVYGELGMEEMANPETAQKMTQAQLLPDGTKLRSLLTKDELERLNAVMREVMGVDFNNDAVAAQMDGLTPMALSTTLAMMVYMKKTPGFNPADQFDFYFQKTAMKQGKPVKGLETAEFQLKLLYGTDIKQQAKDLMCMVDNFSDMTEMVDFISAAYFAQDLDLLSELFVEEEEGPCQGDSEQSAALIEKRNENWLAQIPSIIKQTPTFFAVGAGHLVGEKGILNRLRELGYNVEGVK